MGVEIKSEHIDIGGKSIVLASVRGGKAVIGTCSSGYGAKRGDTSAQTRLFYIGNDPVAEMLCPNHGSKSSDKLISLCTGYSAMDEEIHDTLSESFARLNKGESLAAGLHDVLALLPDGVYTIYYSDYYPTDGAGTFFWGAYNLTHEIHGTAEQNRTIGKTKTYRPCFLIPGAPLDTFESKMLPVTNEAVKTRVCQGIVYHLSGLHSVLLKGHHGSVSCVDARIPYRCAVIEKIRDTYTDEPNKPNPLPAESEIPAEHSEPSKPSKPNELVEPVESAELAEQSESVESTMPDEMSEQSDAAPEESVLGAEAAVSSHARYEPESTKHEGITGFRSASVKIPLELFPREMLKILLETRGEYKPEQYRALVRKTSLVRKKSYSNKVIPHAVLDQCEQMPDCEMMESVFTVEKLTQGQLDALLAGDVEYNNEIIISPNFYSSIVTACNYLQFTNPKKFIEFSLAILDNSDLYATHEYIANRISRVTGKDIYAFFRAVLENHDPGYEKIANIAEKYVTAYEKQFGNQ